MKGVAKIILGTDDCGLEPHATLVASILRRSSIPLWVRCYYRGASMPSGFEVPGLRVEFFPAESDLTGIFPAHVTQPCLDRFLGIRDFTDWDEALVLDWDQIFLMDVAEIFNLNLGDSLIGARLDERSIESAAREWLSRQLPDTLGILAQGKWPWLGVMLNLKEMREIGFWQRFEAIQRALGLEEQLALALAVEGKVTPWPIRYNCVYQWDGEPRSDAVLHFTMPVKPWHGQGIPGEDLWWTERSSWEGLRSGAVTAAAEGTIG